MAILGHCFVTEFPIIITSSTSEHSVATLTNVQSDIKLTLSNVSNPNSYS